MKKLRKNLTCFALTLSLLLSCFILSGCHDTGSSGSARQHTSIASGSPESGSFLSSQETGSSQTAGSEKTVTLKVGLLGISIKPVGVLVAKAKGYFVEEGVTIEFEKVSSMNDAYTAVSTGDLDVYLFSSTAAATFISQGVTSLRVFGGTAGEGAEIMAAKGRGLSIRSAADFSGLTIACQMPETGQMVLKDYLLREGYTIGEPGTGADVSFLYVNDSNTAIEGCVKGEYDLCITNSCLGYYAEDYGVEVVATVSDFVNPYPCCRQTCNLSTYENNFEALVKFETAALRGYAFSRENQEETLDILEEYSGEDRNFLQGQVYGTNTYTPDMRLSLDPNRDACVAFYEAMVNIGQIEPASHISLEEYVVSDVYESALSTLLQREPDHTLWKELTEYFETHNT